MAVTLTFHGACGIVTGSCFRIATADSTILVDCGLFQGTKTVKELNYRPFPFDPKKVDSVLLTHAHIDHCGLLPKLVRAGFDGTIWATAATNDLLSYVLPDSGHIQEWEVERLNARNLRRGRLPIDPIYTQADAERTLGQLSSVTYRHWTDVAKGIRACYWDAGHILGSASIELAIDLPKQSEPLSILFSGDIGPSQKVLHDDPDSPRTLDAVVMETTYGNRVRNDVSPEKRQRKLKKIISGGLKKKGMVLIPSFAVERTQELLFDLDALFDSGDLPVVPIFVDSPLAARATNVFDRHLSHLNDGSSTHPFRRDNIHYLIPAEESKSLNRLTGGAIIMAGSGMADAGRVRHHLKNYLHRPDATVLLVGYQAPGTMGRLLEEGRELVRIQGDEIVVRASIHKMDEYLGHADKPHLLQWLKDRAPIKNDLFLVHGEEESRLDFKDDAQSVCGDTVVIHTPVIGETVRLSKNKSGKVLARRTPILSQSNTVSDWHKGTSKNTRHLVPERCRIGVTFFCGREALVVGQMGFFDLANRYGGLDAKNDPLLKIDAVLGWEDFRADLEAVWRKPAAARKSRAGRKPWDAVVMFKAIILCALYNLSDDQAEYQIRDRLSFMRFLGLGLEDRVPDAKTVWLYREQLARAGAIEGLFAAFDGYLKDQGYLAMGGQIIDASIVAAPKQRNSREENARIKAGETPEGWADKPAKRSQKDTDARWTKKRGQSHYGYKNHINVDRRHKLVRHYEVTDASVHDSQVLDDILDGDNTALGVWADSAYRSAEIEAALKAKGLRSRIHRKGRRNKPLSDREKQGNKTRSSVRVRVEHVFGAQSNDMGGTLVRSIGKVRATARIGLKNLAYNMRRLVQLERLGAATA